MLGRTRGDKHFALPVPGNLDGNVRRCAETIETEPLLRTHAAQPQRAETDDSGAEQRRGFGIGKTLRDFHRKRRRHDGKLSVAAVDVETGEPRALAQILPVAPAELAHAARAMQPRDADALAVGGA